MTGGRKSGRQKIAAKIKGNTQDPQGSCGLWLIKGPHALNTRTNCKYGAPISNGDLLRLEHINTQNNLHVPNGVDLSAANGSETDNWRVMLDEGEVWKEGQRVMLVHDNTNNVLRTVPDSKTFKVSVGMQREANSWWIAEIVSSSWRVPFYSLEPYNHDLEVKPLFIIYGGGICLQHVQTSRNLSSARGYHFSRLENMKSSDQQQTSTVTNITPNTMWVVKGAHKAGDRYNCIPKTVVKNGDIIRLEHYNTQTNLHSHASYTSPITKQQEVTSTGVDGMADNNDNWRVEVLGGEVVWGVNARVRLIHQNTNNALHSHARALDHENYEVSAFNRRDDNDIWAVVFLEILLT